MRRYIQVIGAALALCSLLVALPSPAVAEMVDNRAVQEGGAADEQEVSDSYAAYLLEHDGTVRPEKEILLSTENLTMLEEGKIGAYLEKDNVLLFFENRGKAEFSFTVVEEGLYALRANYTTMETETVKGVEVSVKINGMIPFASASRISLKRSWKTTGPIAQDEDGSDRRPDRNVYPCWQSAFLEDRDGLYNDPLFFWLPKGKVTLEIVCDTGAFALDSLMFCQPETLESYADYAAKNNVASNPAADEEPLYIPAEEPWTTSDVTLYATSDRSSAFTEPADASAIKLNTIGQNMWKNSGEWIQYAFHVETAGYYTISMHARQNLVRGNASTRAVYIDHRILFRELGNIQFPYSDQWYMKTLGDEEPFIIYLDEGDHTLTMKAVIGDIEEIVREVQQAVRDLNTLYRRIIMLTGTKPDIYRDYNLDTAIPNLLGEMTRLSKLLKEKYLAFTDLGVSQGSDSAILERLAYQMDRFVNRPTDIASGLSSWQSNISTLSSWVLTLSEQPLELDYILITPQGQENPVVSGDFWDTLVYRIHMFFASFLHDYSGLAESAEEGSIKVWISLGRDQMQILKDIIDNEFTPTYGILVDLQLVQTGVLEATLAGQGPDVALMIDPSLPVNLAARGAALDLSGMEGFNETVNAFASDATDAYWYKKGCYGLPVTQDFPMLFYRMDIFEELGIQPPTTWNEFYLVTAQLMKHNMTVGINVDVNTYEMLLYQQGLTLYNEDMSATRLDETGALTAFKQWTNLFKKYGLPQSFSFFNRFRTGEMPMGIQMYSTYSQLMAAAPEINGMWKMTTVPGIIQDDGGVNNTVSAISTAAVILKGTKHRENCWNFLKWFVSADTQYSFGTGLEGLLGIAGRYNTANTNALKDLPWSADEYVSIMEQFENICVTPQIPAAYYVTRNLNNAFRQVVYNGEDAREILSIYNEEINKEIKRKNQELRNR